MSSTPKKKPKKPTRSPFHLILIALSIFVLISLFQTPSRPDKVSYSKFKAKVEEGAFSRVFISDPYIVGELKGSSFSEAGTLIGEQKTSDSGMGDLFKVKPSLSTVRVDGDDSLIKLLDETGVEYEYKLQNNAFRDFFLTWILPFGLIFLLWTFLFRRMGGPGSEFMRIGRAQNTLKPASDLKQKFKDVAGQDEAKHELEEVVEFLREPQRFTHLGGQLPKGILLVGPPGTGKTLLARAVAGEAQVPFFSMSGSDFVEMFVGVGASRVRDLFKQAKAKAPCIIFIDELDAVGKARGMGSMGGHDEREQTLNQLLVEMDGFESQAGVIIMAATNRPEILDPALLRAGRFDRQVMVGKPDVGEREAILVLHAKKVKLAEAVSLKKVAQGTPGMVGADLANVINEAALLAARRRSEAVEQEDFEEAIERILAGLEKKKRVINKHEKEVVAHHEAGHAIIATLRGADRVHKISIIPRGVAALGYTMQLPTEDRYLMSRGELINRIDVLLGGQAAEDVIFGEISTGASDDLQRATNIARAMVTQYGMGATLGPATIERERTPMLMDGGSVGVGKNFSEETAKLVDQEIKDLLKDRMRKVKALLKEKHALLKDVALTLLEKETLNDKEFEALVAKHVA